MPRPRHEVRYVGRKVRLPEPLDQKVHLLLLDPLRGRVRSGAWTQLMTSLLQRWVNEQIENRSAAPSNKGDASRWVDGPVD